jgi:hypothetical protein
MPSFLRTVKLGKGANGERLFVIVFGFEHPTAQKELQTLLSSFEVSSLSLSRSLRESLFHLFQPFNSSFFWKNCNRSYR